MTLFTVGPVEMSPRIRRLQSPTSYFRTPEFSDFMPNLEAQILELPRRRKVHVRFC